MNCPTGTGKVVSWDALVEAFVNKEVEVDLAWNGPLAYLKIKRRLNDTCQVVARVAMIVGLVWGWSPYPEVMVDDVSNAAHLGDLA